MENWENRLDRIENICENNTKQIHELAKVTLELKGFIEESAKNTDKAIQEIKSGIGDLINITMQLHAR